MTLQELQSLIDTMYSRKDEERGIEGTFMWLMEEVGELATALRSGTKEELALEFADVLAWLVTIANVSQIDLGAPESLFTSPSMGDSPARCACSTTPVPGAPTSSASSRDRKSVV